MQLQLRMAGSVAGSLGIVGLLLAGMGIYGVTAYTVARRTREIGIRIAMGAKPADIVAIVMGQGMGLVAAGAAIGLILSVAGGRLLKGLLFGAPSVDPLVYMGATLIFLLIGLAACYLPARRAVRIDAMEALRYESEPQFTLLRSRFSLRVQVRFDVHVQGSLARTRAGFATPNPEPGTPEPSTELEHEPRSENREE